MIAIRRSKIELASRMHNQLDISRVTDENHAGMR